MVLVKVLERRLNDGKSGVETIDVVFTELGMSLSPHVMRIREDKVNAFVENGLKDECHLSNPVPLKEKEHVLEMLKAVTR